MPKRANGEGTIYKRPDGRWMARMMIDGKRRDFYGKTQKEVLEKLKEAEYEAKRGTLATGPRQTVQQFFESWLETVQPPALRVSSYVKYKKLVHSYIIPHLGKVQLQKLKPQQVQAFYTTMSKPRGKKPGLAPKTISSIHGVMHKALDTAVLWNLVGKNVCDAVKPPRIVKKEIQPLTIEEAHTFLEVIRSHRLEALFILGLVTGMREGELLGLKWSDIDFEAHTVQVRRTVDFIAPYGFVVNEPKTTSGRRRLSLPTFMMDILKRHRSQQLEYRLKRGDAWQDMNLVFANTKGSYTNSRYVLKLFHQSLQKAGLPRRRFHELRHSAASILLAMGVHPKVVQEILGHSNISITMDLYSHVLPTTHKEAMDMWNAHFDADSGPL